MNEEFKAMVQNLSNCQSAQFIIEKEMKTLAKKSEMKTLKEELAGVRTSAVSLLSRFDDERYSLAKKMNALSEASQALIASLNSTQKFTAVVLKEAGWYMASNGYAYKLSTEKQTYKAAESACGKLGGRLASIGVRNTVDKRELMKFENLQGDFSVWIGLIKQGETNATWIWSDGIISPLRDIDWEDGEPNNGDDGDIKGETVLTS